MNAVHIDEVIAESKAKWEQSSGSLEHLAYLTAVYYLTTKYHSGQWSRGYRLSCLASQRVRREHMGIDLNRQLDNLADRTMKILFRSIYVSRVAYYILKLRKWRFSL